MSQNNEQQEFDNSNEEFQDVGNALVSWETWERQPYERSRNWYIIASAIGITLLVYSIFTANYLFAIIVLMTGIILLTNGLKHPDRIQIHITDMGIVIGNTYHDYKDVKEFAMIYEPPLVKTLYVDFNSVLKPMISIQLEDADPNVVREILLPYVFENLDREDETLTDQLERMYKL